MLAQLFNILLFSKFNYVEQ